MKTSPSLKPLITKNVPGSKIELNDRQIESLKNIGEIVLATSAVLGLVLVSAIAPNALQLLNKVSWARKTYRNLGTKKRDQKNKLAQAFYYLRRHNYVELVPNGQNFIMKITDKGQQRIKEIGFRNLDIKKQAQWDGSWWVIIADIPTELRGQANQFRKKIKELGLYTLQRSVWFYPFNPKDEIAFLAKTYGLDRYITTFKATEMENEDEDNLKSYFKPLLKIR